MSRARSVRKAHAAQDLVEAGIGAKRVEGRVDLQVRHNGSPVWTADGKKVIYLRWTVPADQAASPRPVSRYRLFWQPVDGSAEAEPLVSAEDLEVGGVGGGLFPVGVSPDGSLLAFSHEHPTRRGDIWLLPLGGGGEARPLIASADHEIGAVFAPDGRAVAYWSNKAGKEEIFVRLFDRDDFAGLGLTSYQVSTDGQRILIGKSLVGAGPVTELRVVVNWFEELKERMREAAEVAGQGTGP